MAFEELDRWLEHWAQRQRCGIRETLARELMAIDALGGRRATDPEFDGWPGPARQA